MSLYIFFYYKKNDKTFSIGYLIFPPDNVTRKTEVKE